MKLLYLVTFQEIKAWKSWDYKAKDGSTQVAGFVRQFENLTFLTVKVNTDIYAQRNISISKLQTKIIVKTLRSISKQSCMEIFSCTEMGVKTRGTLLPYPFEDIRFSNATISKASKLLILGSRSHGTTG